MSLFCDHKMFLLPSGIGKARQDLFRRRVEGQGGSCFTDFKLFVNDEKSERESASSKCNDRDGDGSEASAKKKWTHLVVAEDSLTFDVVTKILKLKSPPEAKLWFVKTKWLSDCLKEEKMKDPGGYVITGAEKPSLLPALPPPPPPPPSAPRPQLEPSLLPTALCVSDPIDSEGVSKPKVQRLSNERFSGPKHNNPFAAASHRRSDPIEIPPGECESDSTLEAGNGLVESEASASNSDVREHLPTGNWVCTQASAGQESGENKNSFVISQLEQLCKVYKTTKDQWRQLSYRKAISALKNAADEVKTYTEAIALPGVGSSIAEKIVEIVESGRLRKLESLGKDEKIQCMELFQKVWGVGPTYAETFYNMGYRTLEDLSSKAELTRQQRIGLKHFHDLSQRMSWAEADQIKRFVETVALQIQPGLLVEGCGSYRRKRETCGDVDVLISHPDGTSHEGLFPRLIKHLHESGFLTDDLVRDEINGNQRKYMGVCRLKLSPTKSSQFEAAKAKISINDGGIPSSLETGAQAVDSTATSAEVSAASKPSRLASSSTGFDAATVSSSTSKAPPAFPSTASAAFDDPLGSSTTSKDPPASSSTASAAFDDPLGSSTTSGVHRRIDVIVVPYHEWACARLYFTGSAIFNRSMRALAIKKGMSLSEHSLKSGVIRGGDRVKVHEGTALPTPDEESVFEHLGIPYRTPEEREHGK